MISRPCPICGSSETRKIFAEANFDIDRLDSFAFASRKTPEYMHYRLIECPVCDLLYANPLPSEDFLTEGYGDASYDSSIEAHYAAATYADLLSRFISLLPERSGALDIGAGDGAFLEYLLRHGFDQIVGVEPSRAPIAAARTDIRPLLREGNFRCEDYVSESFNLVTCFQTLEHLYDPLAMARGVYQLLKPGGAVFFVCHNRRALPAQLLGRKSPIYDIEHLQLFSPSSAHFLLEQSGFSNIMLINVVNRYPIRYWLRLLPLSSGVKSLLITTLDRIRIGGWSISVPVGNIGVVGFKPKTELSFLNRVRC